MKPPSVLVVDDDVETLGIVEYWLADAGYDVVTCSRFDAARNYLASHPLDALVTDLRLGEFNGLQLALRASEPGRRIAVVVMSAYDDVVSRRDAEACWRTVHAETVRPRGAADAALGSALDQQTVQR